MMRQWLAAIPLLIAPVAAYVLLTLGFGGPMSVEAGRMLARPLMRLPVAHGGVWPVTAGDLLIAAGLIIAFLDLLKGAGSRRIAVVNHALSIALFVGCLAAMLLAPAFATSTFFLLTLMVLLDLVAGFMVATAPSEAPKKR